MLLDGIGNQGGLNQTGGQLDIGSGGVALGSFSQTAGSFAAGGNFGTTRAFSQAGNGSLVVNGAANIGATLGEVVLGNLASRGPLVVSSTDGAIRQQAGTAILAQSTPQLTASRQGTPAGITLDGAGNDFVGAVSATGGNVVLVDANALTLGRVLTTGDLTLASQGALNLGQTTVGGKLRANSGGGDITQGGALLIKGNSHFDGGRGRIDLSSPGNVFGGTVNSVGAFIGIANPAEDAAGQADQRLRAAESRSTGLLTATPLANPQAVEAALAADGQGLRLPTASVSAVAATTTGGATTTGSATTTVTQLSDVTPQAPGVIQVHLGEQVLRSGAFEFSLPAQATSTVRSQGDPAVALMPDGQALPAWLLFDAGGLTFSAQAVPAEALPMQLRVRAGAYRMRIKITALK